MLNSEWKNRLNRGIYDEELEALCGGDTARQRERYIGLLDSFSGRFGDAEVRVIGAPGRTELSGNHTDHQNGIVLCAAVNRDTIAAVSPRGDSRIVIVSRGFGEISLETDRLDPVPAERGTSEGIVRGIAAGYVRRGFSVGGFSACVDSDVPAGGGLSSSAAFEILIASVFSELYNSGEPDALTRAVIGRGAERDYFGKPSGLMDQASSACGGITKIDFADPARPRVERIDFDFREAGYVLCAVNTRTSHADLTDDYASIPEEMRSVAAFYGGSVLRDIEPSVFRSGTDREALAAAVSPRAILRAEHFFDVNERAARMAEALSRGDMDTYLREMNASGASSRDKLQNVIPSLHPEETSMAAALDRAEELLRGKGAWRIHGGGFAGCIQCLVPEADYAAFRSAMDGTYGEGACFELRVRPCGPHILGSGFAKGD